MAKETFERYEAALTKLDATQREAIIGRFELGCSYRGVGGEDGEAFGGCRPESRLARVGTSRGGNEA